MIESLLLKVKVVPNKKMNKFVKCAGDNFFKVEIKAKPVEGRANQELIKFLAKELGIKQNQIMIIKGVHSREKVLRIDAAAKEKILKKIEEIQSP